MGKNSVLATGLLAGTIIGAGIFSLPYVISRLGLLCGIFYLFAFAFVYFLIHQMYADLFQKHEGAHEIFYFIRNYLPKFLTKFALFVTLGGLIFVLTVYLVLAAAFFGIIFNISVNSAVFIFWFLGSIFIFARLNWLGWAEILGTLSIVLIIGIIIFVSLNLPLKTPLFQKLDFATFFLPFGPLLFSFGGWTAIPKVVEEYRQSKINNKPFSLKKVVFWGSFIPAIVYMFFILGVLKLNPEVSPESLDSLGMLSPSLVVLLGVMGLLTLWTSYFIIGISVKNILNFDLNLSKKLSFFIVLVGPLAIYFLGVKNFLNAISFSGGIFTALQGIFIVMMWQKAFPGGQWQKFCYPLYAVFATAIVYKILTIIF